MEFGLKGTSRVCRGRHGEVGIVEFGHNQITGTIICHYFTCGSVVRASQYSDEKYAVTVNEYEDYGRKIHIYYGSGKGVRN